MATECWKGLLDTDELYFAGGDVEFGGMQKTQYDYGQKLKIDNRVVMLHDYSPDSIFFGGQKKMKKYGDDQNIKIKKKIDSIIAKEFNNIPDEQILYHYTSASSLISIIENKEFWISQRDFMNDKYETKYPSEQFLELFKNNNNINYDPNYFIENFLSSLHNQYILSFSLLSDSLHQWSYYGKNDGYCLGIKKGKLIELLTNLKMEFKYGKVIYDRSIYEPLGKNY